MKLAEMRWIVGSVALMGLVTVATLAWQRQSSPAHQYNAQPIVVENSRISPEDGTSPAPPIDRQYVRRREVASPSPLPGIKPQVIAVCGGGTIAPIDGYEIHDTQTCDKAYALNARWVVEIFGEEEGVIFVDVSQHLEDGYCGSEAGIAAPPGRVECLDQRAQNPSSSKSILAICAATHSLKTWKSLEDTSLQTLLIPSIERTVTEQELKDWDIRLYLGIDHDDTFWIKHHASFRYPSWLTIDPGFYDVSEHQVPFNEMMQHAYNDGAEYMARINDDTEFLTKGWITMGVKTLSGFEPPNVGVVGPTCRQGNVNIMTHDMVHRTHLEIFDHYYPTVFSAWWIDDWITMVYKQKAVRSVQLKEWEVKHHTGKHGTRYTVQRKEKELLEDEVAKGKKRVAAWVARYEVTIGEGTNPHVLSDLSNTEGNSWIAQRVNTNNEKTRVKEPRQMRTCWERYQANIDASKSTAFVPGKSVMMEPSSVKMLCDLLTPTTRVLEWGSGGLTLFFSQFVASWESIEHDSKWYAEMVGYASSKDNVRMHRASHDWNQKGDGTYTEFQGYVELPSDFGRQYDVVIVDGRARVPCARSVIRNSLLASDDGVVVVHDWERVQYKVLLDQFELVQEDATDARHLAVLRPLEISPVITTRITGVRRTGTEYGGWTYNATSLTPHSIVYSVGLGEDTSWDEAMMRDHGLHIWGFDPTPKAIEYVQSNPRLGATFHFTPEGLATEPGTLTFTKPANPDHVSMRQGRHGGLGDTIEVPVDTLGSWMGANGHTQLDILKIDIEGSEYDVLEDYIRRQWFPMDQLLVEFHHRFLKDTSRHTSVLKGLKENGFEVIHDANHQEISFQRRRRPSRPSPRVLERYAARLHAKHGVVLLQILNEGYVEMTKSWICNVRRFGTVLLKTLFVTTDQAAYDALTAFDPTLHVVLEHYTAPTTMEYGEMTYWNYMGFRNDLLLQLARGGVDILLTEADAVWFRDAVPTVLATAGDIVFMSDGKPPAKIVQGGFRLFRSTPGTTALLEDMQQRYTQMLKQHAARANVMDVASDQLLMGRLLPSHPDLAVGWLDPRAYVPGLWYRDEAYRKTVPDPAVVLNNYIIGNDAKIKRAKEWKHWFMNELGKCEL